MKPEPVFVHVADGCGRPARAALRALYKTEPRITGSPTLLVSDYITRNLAFLAQSRRAARSARRARRPGRRADRAARAASPSTIDLCSYRYDAWLLGLVDVQLRAMRARGAAGGGLEAPASISVPTPGSRICGRQPAALDARAGRRRSCARSFAGTDADPAGPGQRRLHPRAVAHSRAHRGGAAQRLSRQRDRGQSADAGGQPVVRPRAAGAVDAGGHPQRPEPRRAARLSVRARAARRSRAGARWTSSSTRCARRSRWWPTTSRRRRRRRACRSRRSRRATSSTAASWSTRSSSGNPGRPIRSANATLPAATARGGCSDQRRG